MDAAASQTPPRPRPALRVGVTVRSLQRSPSGNGDLAPLRTATHTILARIQESAAASAAEYAAVYAGTPVLHCIAPAAPETHSIVTDVARALGYTIAVVTDEGGLIADRTVLRHADVLLRVGLAGEPGDTVAQARAWGIPIVHIDPCAPERWLVEGASPDLAAVVREALAPPREAGKKERRHRWRRHRRTLRSGIAAPLTEYVRTKPEWGVGGLFASIVRLVALERPRLPRFVALGPSTIQRARADWESLWMRRPAVDAAIAAPVRGTLGEYYVWADGLANRFGTLHRDASITPYLLALVTALIAAHVGGVVANAGPVIAAWAIFFLYRHAVRSRYHDRWIDYRSLAEQLRQLAFLWPVGRPLRAVRARGEAGSEAPQIAWIDWYARAVAREAGIFPATLTGQRIGEYRVLLIDRFIRPQYEYHRRTVQRFDAVRSRLHAGALAVFWATMILATVNIVLRAVRHTPAVAPATASATWWVRLAVPAAILLPAVGAGIHGFLGQGDFSNLARRSKSMAEQLHALMSSPPPAEESAESLGDLAEAAAGVMGDEVLNWRVFVRLKGPSLA